jgi:hypothetical protein
VENWRRGEGEKGRSVEVESEEGGSEESGAVMIG